MEIYSELTRLRNERDAARAALAAAQNQYNDLLQSWAEVKEQRDKAHAELAAEREAHSSSIRVREAICADLARDLEESDTTVAKLREVVVMADNELEKRCYAPDSYARGKIYDVLRETGGGHE
jgi:hypothetical protein